MVRLIKCYDLIVPSILISYKLLFKGHYDERYVTNPKLRQRADRMRHAPTEAEARLWYYLRTNRLAGVHFRRQHVIGNTIVDFCAPRKKLVIEVDGGQHVEQQEYDAKRTKFLESHGCRVLRFWNHEVMSDIDAVLDEIWHALNEEA